VFGFVQVREYVRDVVEAAVDTARRTVDAREMAAMPRLACLLYNLTALFSPKTCMVLQTRPSYSGNLNSEVPEDSKNAFLHREYVLDNHNVLVVALSFITRRYACLLRDHSCEHIALLHCGEKRKKKRLHLLASLS